MKKVLVAMSHALTKAQVEDLQKMGFEPVISENFKKQSCNQLPPSLSSKDIKVIAKSIIDEASSFQAIAMTGEPALTFWVWSLAKEGGLTILQSTTERKTTEKLLPDGSVEKKQIFEHVQWREI